jgi:hypothetical protein
MIETEIKILHMYLMCSVNYVSTNSRCSLDLSTELSELSTELRTDFGSLVENS